MSDKTDVLYNDTCPICSREVDHYASLSEKAALPISYTVITDPDTLAGWGITPDEAARRFHVRKDGVLYGGIPAFLILWAEIPETRWLARMVNLPGVYWIACKGYDHLAAPLLYRLNLRRQARD